MVSSTRRLLALLAALLLLPAATLAYKDVQFFVIGDWGRQGTSNQKNVAKLMGQVAKSMKPSFIVSTGDNFYPHGLKHSNDYLFDKSFKQIYTASELRSVPWHAVMGNHDYGDGYSKCDRNKGGSCKCGCEPQLWGNLAGRDGRWRGERGTTKEFGDGLVELFFVDTSPFIDSYQGQSWAYCQRGGILQQSWDWQRKELRKSLKGSNARWKIAIGHHPLRSNGKHGDSRDLKNRLEPVLAEYGVRAYFAGHDHNLEHVDASDRGIQVFVSGSGGDIGYFKGKSRSKFQDKGPGFAAVKITQDRMEVRYYTVDKGASSPAYKTAMKYK